MRKAFLSAAMVLVTAIGLSAAAGAATVQTSAAAARLSTQAAAANYLRSLGIDPASVVVQRGSKNYAGPNCPGAEWNCTNAKQVLQISTTSGINSFTCTPAGGGTTPPSTCVIMQTAVGGGNNTARCLIRRVGSGTAQQSCTVTQTSTSGWNTVEVKQEAGLAGATTSSTQAATIVQNSGSGANTVALTQKSGEAMLSGSSSIGTWSQSASQSLNIDQNSVSGANTVDVWQLVGQAQTALKATAGSQSQTSDQQSTIDQSSGGAATVKVKQTEGQLQIAKTTGVTQTQVGPQRCCSSQVGTPATTSVTQQATQIQKPSNDQVQQQTVVYTSTGNITGTQTATQDGTTSTNTFSGSTVAETQSCTDGTCTQDEPPPPPDSWTSFTWSGGDGTTATGSPFPIVAEGPVVLSVTDIACRGDRFTIYNGATALGTTSEVPVVPCGTGDVPDAPTAFTDPTYSHGTFALADSVGSFGIVVSTSPFGSGGASYSIDPMTPAHCTGGRWATFTAPAFASEAACLAFVAG